MAGAHDPSCFLMHGVLTELHPSHTPITRPISATTASIQLSSCVSRLAACEHTTHPTAITTSNDHAATVFHAFDAAIGSRTSHAEYNFRQEGIHDSSSNTDSVQWQRTLVSRAHEDEDQDQDKRQDHSDSDNRAVSKGLRPLAFGPSGQRMGRHSKGSKRCSTNR